MRNEDTLPPHRPNTPRTWLLRAWEWLKAHPQLAAAFALGFVLGVITL